jgi:hypothetical protein
MLYSFFCVAVMMSCAVAAATVAAEPEPPSPLCRAALRFLGTLDASGKAKVTLAFSSDERLNWHYVPRERKGLPLKEMTPSQHEAALALVRAGLSAKGFEKAETIRSLENILREIEQGRGPVRDPELYYVTLFGEPSESGAKPWGLRFEGHHISFNWTVVQGRALATTPQFLGSNPAEVRSGPMKGARVLHVEEDLAFELLHSLSAEEHRAAVLSETAPADILTSASRKAAIQEDRGLAYSAMTESQKGLLLSLIQEYASAMPPHIARDRLERINKAGLGAVKFAWMGASQKGIGHYYRVQGPTFLIEFDNTQNEANHIHTVWRDFNGDFGEDLLAEHYRDAGPGHGHNHVTSHHP